MAQSRRLKLLASILVPLAWLAGCQTSQQNQVSVDYYSISGNSTADLDQEIKRKGPKINGGNHAVAIARIKMFPKVTYEKKANSCHVASATVTVDARVTLPKWKERETASRKLGAAWDNIENYTRLHEATHVKLAFDFAHQIEQQVLELPATPTCDELRRITKSLVDQNLKAHDKAQRKFDADEQQRFAEIARQASISGSL